MRDWLSAAGGGESGAEAASALLESPWFLAGLAALYLSFLLSSSAVWQYVRAALIRLSLHDLYLGETLRLQSNISPARLAWIGVSNLAAQVLTLGLATPWAAIRRARYLVAHVSVQTITSLDEFSAAATPSESALGEAASEFFDFDLGF